MSSDEDLFGLFCFTGTRLIRMINSGLDRMKYLWNHTPLPPAPVSRRVNPYRGRESGDVIICVDGAVPDVRHIRHERDKGSKRHRRYHHENLPKYSTDDETIGGESVCGRIEGRSPSCTRSGHELQKHIRRTPYHQKNNNEAHMQGGRENNY